MAKEKIRIVWAEKNERIILDPKGYKGKASSCYLYQRYHKVFKKWKTKDFTFSTFVDNSDEKAIDYFLN